jgi:hypothetical protein
MNDITHLLAAVPTSSLPAFHTLISATDEDGETPSIGKVLAESCAYCHRGVQAHGIGCRPCDGDGWRYFRDQGLPYPEHLPLSAGFLKAVMDVDGIRSLEADVQHYSGNEASGYAEINRRKAAAYDKLLKALERK